MPLLLCPNDNGPMQTVSRSGVDFDMCPTCRGVWLDRGELEKLMAASREDAPAGPPPSAAPRPPQPGYTQPGYTQPGYAQPGYAPGGSQYGERGEWGERGEHGEHGHGPGHRRRKGFDLFDIFD